MTERERTLQVAKGLESQGIQPFQFYDQAKGVVKPFDLCACCPGGVFWAIETKQVEIPSWESKACLLGPRSFRPHQLPTLLRVVEQGGRASVVLFVIPPRAVETRGWMLSPKWIAARFRRDEVFRLPDLLEADAMPTYELTRLPRIGWGLNEALLGRMRRTPSDPSPSSAGMGWGAPIPAP